MKTAFRLADYLPTCQLEYAYCYFEPCLGTSFKTKLCFFFSFPSQIVCSLLAMQSLPLSSAKKHWQKGKEYYLDFSFSHPWLEKRIIDNACQKDPFPDYAETVIQIRIKKNLKVKNSRTTYAEGYWGTSLSLEI